MKSLKEIRESLKKLKKSLLKEYPITTLAIFGSYAREEQHDESDLDLLIEFKSPIGIRFIDLAEEIEESLNIKVDLVSKSGIKQKYLKSIDSELIYV